MPDSGQPDSGLFGCVIDGQFYASRALNPGNLAECCNPRTSPGAWLPLLAPGVVVTPVGGPNDGAVGDFNGDGILDLAVSTSGPQKVYVYFGLPNGGGYTSPFIVDEANNWPVDVTIGDMNRDGLDDLVIGTGNINGGQASVTVLLSHGDGGFGEPQVTDTGCSVGPLVVADMDGDGWNDVVAGACGLVAFTNLAQGNGAVSNEKKLPIGSAGSQLAIIDLYPGEPDIATAGNDLLIAINDGGDSFETDDVASLPGGGGGGVAVAQFSGGALPEVVAETSDSLTLVKVAPASGVGTVLSTSSIDTGGQRIAALDLNGDGYPDIVTFSGGGSVLGISINLTDGGFAKGVDIPVPLAVDAGIYGVQMIAEGDLNGDGAPDVLVMIGAYSPANGPVVQYLNNCP